MKNIWMERRQEKYIREPGVVISVDGDYVLFWAAGTSWGATRKDFVEEPKKDQLVWLEVDNLWKPKHFKVHPRSVDKLEALKLQIIAENPMVTGIFYDGYHQSSKAGKVLYKTGFEKRAYEKLDADDTVRTYEVGSVSTKYYHPEKKVERTYIIDLLVEYLDGSKKLVDVRAERQSEDKVALAKMEAGRTKAKRMGCVFEVWTEKQLFEGDKP